MKKLLGVILAITTISTEVYANQEEYEVLLKNSENCKNLDMPTVLNYLKQKKGDVFENPFNNICTPISFTEKDTSVLTVKDFGMNQNAYNSYLKFLEMKDMQVVPAFIHEGVIYKYFKFNTESSDTPKFYNSIRNKEFLYENKELWSFFHELMHLSDNHTHKQELSSLEFQADIGATLFVSLHSKLTLEKTIDAINSVKMVRVNGPRQHYNRNNFINAKKNIKNLDFDYLKTFDLNSPDSFEKVAKLIDKICQDIGTLSEKEFKNKHGKLNVKGEKI